MNNEWNQRPTDSAETTGTVPVSPAADAAAEASSAVPAAVVPDADPSAGVSTAAVAAPAVPAPAAAPAHKKHRRVIPDTPEALRHALITAERGHKLGCYAGGVLTAGLLAQTLPIAVWQFYLVCVAAGLAIGALLWLVTTGLRNFLLDEHDKAVSITVTVFLILAIPTLCLLLRAPMLH